MEIDSEESMFSYNFKQLSLGMAVGLLSLQSASCTQWMDEPVRGAVTSNKTKEIKLDIHKFSLDNGLEVILHRDTSDPIVALTTMVHVGSNREKKGRTGFAHFFEHMSFKDSENVPRGSNRKYIPELGGIRNGGTWRDGTIYYEVVPKDAFEKLLWIDSDRLGYMINTVAKNELENEKQVVKNEKRQRVDNRPYGHTGTVIAKALYPEGHPYSWPVIGELEDLQNATLEDVKEFYHKYYVPNNVTFVIAGDIEIEKTKKLVHKWFGEIKRGPEVPLPERNLVKLKNSKKLYHLDNFAKLPEMRIVFPTVDSKSKDSAALDILGEILSSKQSPIYKTIVEQEKMAAFITASHDSSEIAGEFVFTVRASDKIPLDKIYSSFRSSLDQFVAGIVSNSDLEAIKVAEIAKMYAQMSTVLGKARMLATSNEYFQDPLYFNQQLKNIEAVTPVDIKRVFTKYIEGKPYLATSFVPRSNPDLVLTGSVRAAIKEEPIVIGAEKVYMPSMMKYKKSPSSFPRNEPPLSGKFAFTLPKLQKVKETNGTEIYLFQDDEVPLVNFSITWDGGQYILKKNQAGAAEALVAVLSEGSETLDSATFEKIVKQLGAKIDVSVDNHQIEISGYTLAENFEETMAVIEDMVFQPRFDSKTLAKVKRKQLAAIVQSYGSPLAIARKTTRQITYNKNHPLYQDSLGSKETVKALTVKDLTSLWSQHLVGARIHFHAVGAVTIDRIQKSLSGRWRDIPRGTAVNFELPLIKPDGKAQVYFIDVPGSKQSVIIGRIPGVDGNHRDFENIVFANQRIGGGMSARLAQVLRIQKGYTYGAGSYHTKAPFQSPWMLSTSVRSNVTLESLQEIQKILKNYAKDFSGEDLTVTKNMLVKNKAIKYEAGDSRLNLLRELSLFEMDEDEFLLIQNNLLDLKRSDVQKIIGTYLNPKNIDYIVVGDAKTQLNRLGRLGLGKPILLKVGGKV